MYDQFYYLDCVQVLSVFRRDEAVALLLNSFITVIEWPWLMVLCYETVSAAGEHVMTVSYQVSRGAFLFLTRNMVRLSVGSDLVLFLLITFYRFLGIVLSWYIYY